MVHWIRASKKQAVLYKSGSKIDIFPKINPSQETSEGWSSSLPQPAWPSNLNSLAGFLCSCLLSWMHLSVPNFPFWHLLPARGAFLDRALQHHAEHFLVFSSTSQKVLSGTQFDFHSCFFAIELLLLCFFGVWLVVMLLGGWNRYIGPIGVLTEYLIYWFVGRGRQLFGKFELYQLTVMRFPSRKIAILAIHIF